MENELFVKELTEKILNIKRDLGPELVILAHHYQRMEIVDLSDYRGDSFGLSRQAASNTEAKYIVFCGVHFMAESAAIMAQPHQIVQMPNVDAGCWMADMADHVLVEKAWEELRNVIDIDSVTPIVYMNADAEIKAFCGRHGGLVCTSSNASAAFKEAFRERERIIFFPDQHLGRNTGNSMDIPSDEMIVWDPDKSLGGNTRESIKKARVILWDGYCLVHTRFKERHIDHMRLNHPGAKIIVHPECTQEVVRMADATGSTSGIVKYVNEALPGETVVIGTEINLIKRLARENPDKQVLPLHDSLCPNMSKINLENLLYTLENIGEVNIVTVTDDVKRDARIALERMMALKV